MSSELEAFLLSIGCGVVMLLLWDIFHGMRMAVFKGFFINLILDISWWVIAVILFVYCMWQTVSLQLRFYEVIALAIGAILYKITVSSLLRRMFCYTFEIFFKIIKFILKILLTPALFLDRIIIKMFKRGK